MTFNPALLLVLMLVAGVLGACDETPRTLPVTADVERVPSLESIWLEMDGVIDVGMVSVMQTETGWLVYGEVEVADGYNTLAMAEAMQQATLTALVSGFVDFSVILDDGTGAVDYARWTYKDDWIISPRELG